MLVEKKDYTLETTTAKVLFTAKTNINNIEQMFACTLLDIDVCVCVWGRVCICVWYECEQFPFP